MSSNYCIIMYLIILLDDVEGAWQQLCRVCYLIQFIFIFNEHLTMHSVAA